MSLNVRKQKCCNCSHNDAIDGVLCAERHFYVYSIHCWFIHIVGIFSALSTSIVFNIWVVKTLFISIYHYFQFFYFLLVIFVGDIDYRVCISPGIIALHCMVLNRKLLIAIRNFKFNIQIFPSVISEICSILSLAVKRNSRIVYVCFVSFYYCKHACARSMNKEFQKRKKNSFKMHSQNWYAMNLSESKYSICSIITDLIDDSHDHEPQTSGMWCKEESQSVYKWWLIHSIKCVLKQFSKKKNAIYQEWHGPASTYAKWI